MNEKTNKNIRLYYGIALGVMTVTVGALFIWQALSIYLAGNNPYYTAERISQSFLRISPAFWIWIVMIVGGFVIWEVFPVKRKLSAYNDLRYSLYRLKKRMPERFEGSLSAEYGAFKREERNLNILRGFVALAFVICAVFTVAYLATSSNFPKDKDIPANVFEMVKHVMPLVAEVFLLAMLAARAEEEIINRQLPSAKKLAAVKRTQENERAVPSNKLLAFAYVAKLKLKALTSNKFFKPCVQIAIGCVGAAFVIAGILNGNAGGILMKAIKICLECIGIG